MIKFATSKLYLHVDIFSLKTCIVRWVLFVSVCFSYSRYVRQSASREAFGQQALKVCGPLNGKQKQFHLNLLSPCSHHFG